MIRMKTKKTPTVKSQSDYSFWLFNVVMTLIFASKGLKLLSILKNFRGLRLAYPVPPRKMIPGSGFLSYRASDSKVLSSWRFFYRVRKKNGSKYHYMTPVS